MSVSRQSAPSVFYSESLAYLFTPELGKRHGETDYSSQRKRRNLDPRAEQTTEVRSPCNSEPSAQSPPSPELNYTEGDELSNGSEERSRIDSNPTRSSNEILERPQGTAATPDQTDLGNGPELSKIADIYGFLAKYGVAVCTICRIGVPPSNIRGHLNLHSSDKRYKDWIASVVNSWELKKPQEAIPSHRVPWIRALESPEHGLRCTYTNSTNGAVCTYACRKERTLKDHWSEKHGFKSWSRGVQARQQSQPMKEVRVQRFFNCVCKSWFEVEYDESEVRRQS